MRKLTVAVLLFIASGLHAQWTSIGDMPQPARAGNALRFENAQAVAVITALSLELRS
jgi:hypothetical protein